MRMRTTMCSGWRGGLLLLLPILFFLSHLSSVLELHHGTIAVDVHGTKKKPGQNKFDHLVVGPAAGEGLPDHLQCRGIKALNKTYHSSSAGLSNSGASVAFVSFFTVYNSAISGRVDSDSVTVANVSYSKFERSMAILDTYVRFIQVAMPRSNIYILTDPASDLHVRQERVIIHPIQGQYSREHLMLQRIRSYIAFLDTMLEELPKPLQNGQIIHYIFTDSDIAVVDDLSQIFHEYPNLHMALTFRNNRDQPLNSGFIAVRGTQEGIQRARNFLLEVLKAYTTRYMKASRMLGDQLALAWVVKAHMSFDLRRFTKPVAFMEMMNTTSVLFLPCAFYNWTPPEGAGQFHGMPLDVKVVHFKGSRKRLMLEAWNHFNSSSNMADTLCLILASGRTKYDF